VIEKQIDISIIAGIVAREPARLKPIGSSSG